MSPTPLPGLDLDLDYPAADPAVRLAERAVLAGRRRRRRNRFGVAAAALLLCAAAGSWWAGGTPGTPDGSVRVAASPFSGLPVAVGRGPARSVFVDPTFHGAPGSREGLAPYPDRVVDLGSLEGLAPQRAYLTRDGSFCTVVDGTLSDTTDTSCRPLDALPAEGIWAASGIAAARSEPGDTRTLDGAGATVTRLTVTGSVSVVGVVRGPVSRVLVALPGGRPTDARLLTAPKAELGTLFVAVLPWTPSADAAGRTDPSVTDAPPTPGPSASLSMGPDPSSVAGFVIVEAGTPLDITVHRGDQAVFHCREQTCPGL